MACHQVNNVEEWFKRANGVEYFEATKSMNFTIVILDEHVSAYPKMEWADWKDENRKQMISQGDHWSKTTLAGADIWDCLETNQIDPQHVVQWKPESDKLHQVSLPLHNHPFGSSKN